MNYTVPLQQIRFALENHAELGKVCGTGAFAEVNPELVAMVLGEAAKLAETALAPLSAAAEHAAPTLHEGRVRETPGFAELYAQLVAGGWTAISAGAAYGGMGLPQSVGFASMEIWSSANLSFALCPMLSQGAVEAVEHHASEALKQTFLERLIDGTWAGTMNLTEPQAGSDLAAIKTKAQPAGDHYRITGSKIFITWGDHGMTENIVHLVLARIDGAPAGVAGVSLFVVPKYLVGADGSIGEHNDVYPIALEAKMGIHGSPTCAMNYGDAGEGAVGYLVGEENRGLAYMFTMMNHARLNVGIQGVALSERAYQHAHAYASERVQGKPVSQPDGPIIHHADVGRMLLLMRSLTEASRALCYATAGSMDLAAQTEDREVAGVHQARCDLLIPLAKAWSTEVAQEVTSLGVQVHGGMGYIEESGAAQLLRDARILTIYEGTTGIQANDFAGRKVLRDRGEALRALLSEARDTQRSLATHAEVAAAVAALSEAIDALETSLDWLLGLDPSDERRRDAAAVNLLMGCGTVVAGWLMARSALVAFAALEADPEFYGAKIRTFRFFAMHVLPRAHAYLSAARWGSDEDFV